MEITLETPGYRTRNDYIINWESQAALSPLPDANYFTDLEKTLYFSRKPDGSVLLMGDTITNQDINNTQILFSFAPGDLVPASQQFYLNYCLLSLYTPDTNFFPGTTIYSLFTNRMLYFFSSGTVTTGTKINIFLRLSPFSYFKIDK